jgi:hypothetical protein
VKSFGGREVEHAAFVMDGGIEADEFGEEKVAGFFRDSGFVQGEERIGLDP